MTGTAHTGQQVTDAVPFLDRHLPRTGQRCIAHHSSGQFLPTFHPDNQRAAA